MSSTLPISSGSSSARVVAVDVARGIAVVGVVFNHAVNGLQSSGLVHHQDLLDRVNDTMYIVRMPALAFLMGLLIPRGIARHGHLPYVRRRVVLGLWLYSVWYVVMALAEVLAGSVSNHADAPRSIFSPWFATAHLWFLPYLAVAAVVVTALWWRGRPPLPLVVGLGLAISLGLWTLNSPVIGLRGLSLLAFTLAGAAIGIDTLSRLLREHRRALTLAGLVGAGLLVVLQARVQLLPASLSPWETGHVGAEIGLDERGWSIVGATGGIVAVLAVARWLATRRLPRRVIGHLGRRALEIYVAHVLVVAGARVVLVRLGVDEVPILLVAGVAAGVVVPVLLAPVARRLAPWLFDAPQRLVGTPRTREGRPAPDRASRPVPPSWPKVTCRR